MEIIEWKGKKYGTLSEEVAMAAYQDERMLDEEVEWHTLASYGFPNYVVNSVGEVWQLGHPGILVRQLSQSLRGPRKFASVTVRGKLKRITGRQGRPTYDEITRQFFVHRLMAEYFVPRPVGAKHVGFIDGNKDNLEASNLYWK